MREGTAPLSPVPLYFSSLSLPPHRSPLSERLEQANRESNKASKESQGPTIGGFFTEVSVL